MDRHNESEFPVGAIANGATLVPTLTKREFISAMALQACMRSSHVDGYGDPGRHAKLAVQYAEALLDELEKEA